MDIIKLPSKKTYIPINSLVSELAGKFILFLSILNISNFSFMTALIVSFGYVCFIASQELFMLQCFSLSFLTLLMEYFNI